MADVFTSVLQLLKQETGNNNNNWGVLLNSQVIDRVEQAIAGQSTIGVTGGTTTLTDDQARSAILSISGVLTSASIIEVPARSKAWLIYNSTTGAFPVTIRVTGQAGFILPRGQLQELYCDGTNMLEPGAGQIPVGGTTYFMGATVPANFLEMNGAFVSRSTYARLYAAIGTTWGAGDGSTTFGLPDARDRYLRGKSATYGLGYLGQDIQPHAHTASADAQGGHGHTGTANSAGAHTHTVGPFLNGVVVASGFQGGSGLNVTSGNDTTTSNGAHTHTLTVDAVGNHAHNITVNSTGGTETRPNSLQGIACIRAQ